MKPDTTILTGVGPVHSIVCQLLGAVGYTSGLRSRWVHRTRGRSRLARSAPRLRGAALPHVWWPVRTVQGQESGRHLKSRLPATTRNFLVAHPMGQ